MAGQSNCRRSFALHLQSRVVMNLMLVFQLYSLQGICAFETIYVLDFTLKEGGPRCRKCKIKQYKKQDRHYTTIQRQYMALFFKFKKPTDITAISQEKKLGYVDIIIASEKPCWIMTKGSTVQHPVSDRGTTRCVCGKSTRWRKSFS